jgi:hypothetical protein
MGAFGNFPFAYPIRFQALDGTIMPNTMAHFQQNALVTIANTAVETTAFTTGVGSRTFQGGWFNVDTILRISILGSIKTLDAAETLRLRMYLGATVIMDDAGPTYPSIATATAFRRNIDASFSAVGAAGSCAAGSTELLFGSTLGTIGDSITPSITAINTTQPQTLNITYTWGAADPANVLLIYGIMVECIG